MSEGEALVTLFLGTLAQTQQLLAAKSIQVRRDGMTTVTHVIEAGADGFWGIVDGEKAKVGGLAWTFEVSRERDKGWRVERKLKLNADGATGQETVCELAVARCDSSSRLARELPRLVEELLAIPAPS